MKAGDKQDRKTFIKKAALGTAGFFLLNSLESCTPADPEMLLGKTSALEGGGTLTADFNGDRVMAMRNRKGNIVIFSLVCRHKRCTVEWKPNVAEFHCPCHEGKYNAEGNVLSGPPPGPMVRFKHEERGEDLWILNEAG